LDILFVFFKLGFLFPSKIVNFNCLQFTVTFQLAKTLTWQVAHLT
jgi:hypothetical protein